MQFSEIIACSYGSLRQELIDVWLRLCFAFPQLIPDDRQLLVPHRIVSLDSARIKPKSESKGAAPAGIKVRRLTLNPFPQQPIPDVKLNT